MEIFTGVIRHISEIIIPSIRSIRSAAVQMQAIMSGQM